MAKLFPISINLAHPRWSRWWVAPIFALGALLSAEGVFRLIGIGQASGTPTAHGFEAALIRLPRNRVTGVSTQLHPGSEVHFVYPSNPRGYFGFHGEVTCVLNSEGFRGSDFCAERTPGVPRVMILGDAVAFGEGVHLEHTMGKQLESVLEHHYGLAVEVYVCAVGPWNTEDELNYLQFRGLEFNPDVVLMVTTLDDTRDLGELQLWNEYRNPENPGFGKWSSLANCAHEVFDRRTQTRRFLEESVMLGSSQAARWENSLSLLTHAKQIVQASGGEFCVVLFPFLHNLSDSYPFHRLHEKLSTHCQNQGIGMLDLLPAFRGQEATDLWVHPEDPAPNDVAHRLAARTIAPFLLRRLPSGS